eukprot:SAG25_NODE_220_length_11624_cov_41.246508_10_plen_61_part_01
MISIKLVKRCFTFLCGAGACLPWLLSVFQGGRGATALGCGAAAATAAAADVCWLAAAAAAA